MSQEGAATMRKTKEDTLKRYALYLKELHDRTRESSSVDFEALTRKYQVTKQLHYATLKLGIISKNGKGSKWQVGDSSLKMAEQCRDYLVTEQRHKKKEKKSLVENTIKVHFPIDKEFIMPNKPDMVLLPLSILKRIDQLEYDVSILRSVLSTERKQRKHFRFQFPIIFRKPIIEKS